jgi:integrase
LAAKNQSAEQRHQAAQAIGLLLGRRAELSTGLPVQNAEGPATPPPTPGVQKLLGHSDIKTTMIYLQTVPDVTLKEAKSPLDLGR